MFFEVPNEPDRMEAPKDPASLKSVINLDQLVSDVCDELWLWRFSFSNVVASARQQAVSWRSAGGFRHGEAKAPDITRYCSR